MDYTPYIEFAKDKLGCEFNNIELLVTALTHRSYVNEHKDNSEHNERLEFLGDAVLELVTSDFLYRTYDEPEGIMTAVRAALVRTESICEAGKELGYAPLVRLSKGEQQGLERAHDVILADCFEAVVGAVYLDQGYEVARELINKCIISKIDVVIEEGLWRDPKSYLQELAQKFDGITPVYHTLKDEGPDHNKMFTVGLYVEERLIGTGSGHSKQDAQTEAAREGIRWYRQNHPGEIEEGLKLHKSKE